MTVRTPRSAFMDDGEEFAPGEKSVYGYAVALTVIVMGLAGDKASSGSPGVKASGGTCLEETIYEV